MAVNEATMLVLNFSGTWEVSRDGTPLRVRMLRERGELAEAESTVQGVLPALETHPAGAKEPMWLYLSCYCILAAVEDPRAPKVLVEAQRLLAEQAATLEEEAWRRAFFEAVEVHRAIRHAEDPATSEM